MDTDRPKDPPQSVPPGDAKHFDPENLIKTVIAVPLLKDIAADPAAFALRYYQRICGVHLGWLGIKTFDLILERFGWGSQRPIEK